AGGHTITAVYSGDTKFGTSTSAPLTQTVSAAVAPSNLSGRTLNDATGNGISSDDTPLPGVTINLYKDLNNNGELDSGDGSPVAPTTSSSAGTYTFAGVAAGNYFVREIVPTNYIRTAPALEDYYTVTVTAGQSQSSLDFDNFQKCTAVVSCVSFKIK